ncbi:MAG: hypothetical protein IAI50_01335 [Candidatus Eremiobacteraeota bacterium]|nr:hypothetical protein [Candidatus Eremiobacteraeota bacterium]
MSPARVVLLVVVLALVGAEIVRPTTVPAKRLSHPSLTRGAGQLPLDHYHLDDLPPIVQPAIGNIDGVDAIVAGTARPIVPVTLLGRNDVLAVSGWCADPEARAAGAGLLAIVDDYVRIDVSSSYGNPRLDVARLYATPAMEAVGFDFRLSAAQIGAGTHALRVAVVAADGHGIFIFPTIAHVTVTL